MVGGAAHAGGGGVRGGVRARSGVGGSVPSAAKGHRAVVRGEARLGLGKDGLGTRGATGVGRATDDLGARTLLGGAEPRRAPSTGANHGGDRGSASPSPRGHTGPGRTPPEGHRGGRAGLSSGALWPGSREYVGRRGGDGAGPRAAAGEGLALKGRGASDANPERPAGAGQGFPRAAVPSGGGGAPFPGEDEGPSCVGGGAGVCRPE